MEVAENISTSVATKKKRLLDVCSWISQGGVIPLIHYTQYIISFMSMDTHGYTAWTRKANFWMYWEEIVCYLGIDVKSKIDQ